MVRLLACLLVGVVASGAVAADGRHCLPFAAMKDKDAFKGATFTDLTPGQTNFARGLFVMDTRTPEGMPRGSKAVLFSRGQERIILWLNGPLVCAFESVTPAIDEFLSQIKTGRTDSQGDEL